MFEKKKGLPYLIIPLLVLGASGIVAQTVLLRELLVLFAGNELSLGIIFAAWVVCEAAGSFAAGSWPGLLPKRAGVFVCASLLFSRLFPAAIYLARIYKQLAGIPVELGIGFGQVIGASFLVLFSVAFLHGFLFINACSLYERLTGAGTAAAGKVYFWETVGTILGGIVVSYILIPFSDSFQTALNMAFINGCACLLIVCGGREKRRLTAAAATIFALAVLVCIAAGGAERLHRGSLAAEWEGKNLVAYRNSFYQNIAVVRNEGQYTFFTDGVPLVTTPVPDIGYVEEFVHFPLLAHPAPKTVLVLGGGAGGVIAEILKYRTVQRIDYVESDPALLKTIADFPTPLTSAELRNPLVHLHHGDPRLFLRQTPLRYDIVLLNLPLPQTLLANRLFTSECFAAVKGVLGQGGIFAFPVTGSLTYYSRELKAVNASCLATLDTVFAHRLIVPGDTNLVLASAAPEVETVTSALMAARLAGRGVPASLITPEHLAFRLDRERAGWLDKSLRGYAAQINHDFSPKGLFYNMVFRNILFSPQMKEVFNLAGKTTFSSTAAVAVGLLCIAFFLGVRYPVVTVPAVIAGTGFSAMIFELLLFFGFQILYGHVYYLVGLLTGAFMGGIAAGSLTVTRFLPRIKNDGRLLLFMEGNIVIFALLLALLFAVFDGAESAAYPFAYPLFLLLLIIAGFLTGMEFPLAVRMRARNAGISTMEQSAGLIYGVDLAGGFFGGLLGGALLIPVLGFVNCCILVAVLKGGTFLLAAFTVKRGACF